MNLKTNKLLLISGILIGVTLIISTFWIELGFSVEQTPILTFPFFIAFGLNIAGLIFAFSEKKNDGKKSMIGVFGNLGMIILFFSICTYALMTMN